MTNCSHVKHARQSNPVKGILYGSLQKRTETRTEPEPDYPEDSPLDELFKRNQDEVPMVYMCATMWHETVDEMIQILKSVFR